jgi:hypothetical protein
LRTTHYWLQNKEQYQCKPCSTRTTLRSGALIIHITPPIFDERKEKAYANVLDIYSDWLISCRYTKNWNEVNIHWPMKKYLEGRRAVDSALFMQKMAYIQIKLDIG